MEKFKKFETIKQAKTVCLIAHKEPDADALSSIVLLKDFLVEHFNINKVDLFAEGTISGTYLQILGDYSINKQTVKEYDAAVILDCPSVERTGIYAKLYNNAKMKFNIDHHSTNGFTNCVRYLDEVSSTCEILYALFKFYKYKLSNSQLGKIYAALLTDTDGFSVGAISANTYRIAAECVEKIDADFIYRAFLKHKSLKNQQIYAKTIQNVKEIDKRAIITYITEEQLKELGVQSKDTFGIINQLQCIYNAQLICFVYKNGKEYYVSLRAKKGYNVAQIALKYGGGGHVCAAAYLSSKSLTEILKEVEAEFKEQLDSVKLPPKVLFKD